MKSISSAPTMQPMNTMNMTVMAMILFIASEAIFFLLLILSYVNFHRQAGTGAEAAAMLDPVKTGIFSIALLSSSLTMWFAERSRKGNGKTTAIWLAVTVILGATFLCGQGLEYADLLEHQVTISRDLFGATFFTLTGFHGFHVFIGLLLLTLLFGLAAFGRKGEPTVHVMDAIALYWHFVDAVWIVIFSIVYLWRYV